MWPSAAHVTEEVETFFESHLCLFAESPIFHKAVLEVYGGNYGNALSDSRIRYFKILRLGKFKEMNHPARVEGQLLEGVSKKGLGHCSAKFP